MFYTYKDTRLHYEVIGTGKPAFLLHGLGCNLDLMKGCMEPAFKAVEGYQRIYVDLPGMGQSDASLAYSSADKILEILTAFISNLTNENFLLIGESYGGYLARGILAKVPHCVDGMLLLCPVVLPKHEERTLPKTNIKFVDTAFLNSLSQTQAADFCEYSVIANEEVYRRYQKEILPGLKAANAEFIEQLEKNYSFSFDVDQEIKNIHFQKPVLFISGRQDTCVGYRNLWELIEAYPRATFSVLDAAGHNLQIEQPELFHSLAKNWLVRTESFQ